MVKDLNEEILLPDLTESMKRMLKNFWFKYSLLLVSINVDYIVVIVLI